MNKKVSNEVILRAFKSIKIKQKPFCKTAIEFGINVQTLTLQKNDLRATTDPAIKSSLHFHHKNTRQVGFCLT